MFDELRKRGIRMRSVSLSGPEPRTMHSIVAQHADSVFAANRARGRVDLAVAASAGVTRRSRVHESGSLRVRFPAVASGELEAVLLNTAGGMIGGDHYGVRVAVGEQAQLAITSAAAEKVYGSLGPQVAVNLKIDIAAKGALAWIPQETILYNNFKLARAIEIDLAETAQLLLIESLVFGRAGMGEIVQNGALHEHWRVRRDGRLIYADGVTFEGALAGRLARAAVAKGAHAIATLLMIPGDEAIADKVRALREEIGGEIGVSAWNGIALVRFCACDSAVLRHDLMKVVGALRATPLPRLWTN
jgi:urease accessory protein